MKFPNYQLYEKFIEKPLFVGRLVLYMLSVHVHHRQSVCGWMVPQWHLPAACNGSRNSTQVSHLFFSEDVLDCP